MGCRNELSLLVQYKNDCSNNAGFGGEARLHDFDGRWIPKAPQEPFKYFEERRTITFDHTNDDHDEVSIRVYLGCMRDPIVNLLTTGDFFHKCNHQLAREELAYLVHEVERRIEDGIPNPGCQEKLLVVLEDP